MTELELVIAEIKKLSPDEQSQFLMWILEELYSKDHWSKFVGKSSDMLENLADEILEEHKAKKTQKLNPDTL